MKGMKGWGPSIVQRNPDGEELIPTTALLEVFPTMSRVQFGRVLARAGVVEDPIVRGARGERYWPRARAVSALVLWELSRKGRGV